MVMDFPASTNSRDMAETPDSGYASSLYAASHAEFGEVLPLRRSGGALLARNIAGSRFRDAIGPYPLLCCHNFGGLAGDLTELAADIVAVSAVTDPLGAYEVQDLEAAFDIVREYKPHYLADLRRPFHSYMRRHHLRYTRRALERVRVDRVEDPSGCAQEWEFLYELQRRRFGITGIRAFSTAAFEKQLAVPGCLYFRASVAAGMVGALMCYQVGRRVYAHLIGSTDEGRAILAQYALYWHAIEFSRGVADWFCLGSVPDGPLGGGLAFFKAGWATEARPSYFCGKVVLPDVYAQLAATAGEVTRFPAYRTSL
jgi:hypothetical protein